LARVADYTHYSPEIHMGLEIFCDMMRLFPFANILELLWA